MNVKLPEATFENAETSKAAVFHMKRQETHSTLAEDLRSLQNLARSVLAEKARDVPLKPSEAI